MKRLLPLVPGLLLITSSALAEETSTTTTVTTTETTTMAPPARAEKRGLEIGLRVGAGLGAGVVLHRASTNEDVKLIDQGTIVLPLTLEVGYRVNPLFYVGAFGTWSWISPRKDSKSFCTDQTDTCSVSNSMIGADVRFHPMPELGADPWISLGAGYEWARDRATAGPVEAKSMFSGMQWVNLGIGADFTVAPKLTVGPYANATLGQYTHLSRTVTGAGPASVDLDGPVDDFGEKRVHSWISLGVRGAFTL